MTHVRPDGLIADLGERYSQGEIRVSHEQNLILPHVALDDLPAIHEALAAANLATPNAGLVTDIIACPGLDYCALANARSIPVAQRISERFADQARQNEVGDLKIKISGCINACGHHHVGHIGILGVEKKGEEFYQITLGAPAMRPPRSARSSVRLLVGRRCRCDRNGRRHLPEDLRKPCGDLPGGVSPARTAPFKEALAAPLDALAVAVAPESGADAGRVAECAVWRAGGGAIIEASVREIFTGRVALVSSFGAESAVLLHMIAEVDRVVPVVFLDTLKLFSETLAYRDALVARLGLTDVRSIQPDPARLQLKDPHKALWMTNPDFCCRIRKTEPLQRALSGFDAWFTGRKRFQNSARADLKTFEADGRRIKINPLAAWTGDRLKAYAVRHDLPEHPLVGKGYLSVGCVPCTTKVEAGEDVRAGRWRGLDKIECGIHTELEIDGSGI